MAQGVQRQDFAFFDDLEQRQGKITGDAENLVDAVGFQCFENLLCEVHLIDGGSYVHFIQADINDQLCQDFMLKLLEQFVLFQHRPPDFAGRVTEITGLKSRLLVILSK